MFDKRTWRKIKNAQFTVGSRALIQIILDILERFEVHFSD